MRAVVFHEHGGLDKLHVEDVPRPEPAAGEVLVQIKAAALNHLDVHTRRGIPGFKLPLPHIGGCDGAGLVSAHGAGVTAPRIGARVAINPLLVDGTCEFCVGGDESLCPRIRLLGEHVTGTFAEFAVVPARNLLAMPDAMSFETAAAVPLVYQTAWRMMRRARVSAGEDVLVLGASGGVASAAIQLARHLGARVLAAAGGAEKLARAQALGAEVLIDSSKEDVARRVREVTGKRGVDVVIDHVGKATYQAAIRSLRRGGRMVVCGATTGNDPPAELHYIFWNQLEVIGSTMASFAETAEVWRLVCDGKVAPVIDSVLPLASCAEGQRRLEAREHFGKIVLSV